MGLATRREIFKSSGILFAMSATEMFPKSLLAQAPVAKLKGSVGLSSSLGYYVSDTANTLVHKISQGSVTSYHLKHLSSATHLIARHIEGSGFDEQWKSSLGKFDFVAYSSQYSGYCKQKAAALAQYDPTLAQSGTPPSQMSSDDFANSKANMSTIGSLSGVLHMTADSYLHATKRLTSNAYQPALWNSARTAGTLSSRHSAPHFQLVCDSHKGDKETICKNFDATAKTIEITGGVLAAIGALCAAELVTGPLEPVLCGLGAAALGLSLFFHGLALEHLIALAGC